MLSGHDCPALVDRNIGASVSEWSHRSLNSPLFHADFLQGLATEGIAEEVWLSKVGLVERELAVLRLPEEILAARSEGRLSVAHDCVSRGLLDRFSTGQGVIVIAELGQWFLSSQA